MSHPVYADADHSWSWNDKKFIAWPIHMSCNPEYELSIYGLYITKTRLFKYIENFTSKNWKFLDKNLILF